MKARTLPRKTVLTALFSVMIGLIFAALFLFNSSTGAELDDPDQIFEQAIENSVDEEGNWAYQSSVIDGDNYLGIESVIAFGNSDNEDLMIELFGLDIQLLVQDGEYYLLTSSKSLDKNEGYGGVIALSPQETILAQRLIEQLADSGLLATPEQLLEFEVINTLTKERLDDRLNKHYEVTRTVDVQLDSLGKLLSIVGYEIEPTHQNEAVISTMSGDLWIVDESNKLSRLEYQVEDEQAAYLVNVSPIKPIDQSEYLIGPDQVVVSTDSFKDLDVAKVAKELGLGVISKHITDLANYSDLLAINTLVKEFAAENFYYPTLDELAELVEEEFTKTLGLVVFYQPSQESCDNTDDNYCSGYVIWIDSLVDGVGDRDADDNPVDYSVSKT